MVRHYQYGSPCPCGVEQVTELQQYLLGQFDNWYGDKAYRQHEEVMGWTDGISMLLSAQDPNGPPWPTPGTWCNCGQFSDDPNSWHPVGYAGCVLEEAP